MIFKSQRFLCDLVYLIMAPIVAVAMRSEINKNFENMKKLENFDIFKGCADEYT